MRIIFSTDSGIDNPFRPEGELSMEADEIVRAIKEGRPFDSIDSGRVSRQANGSLTAKNGSAKSPSGKKVRSTLTSASIQKLRFELK